MSNDAIRQLFFTDQYDVSMTNSTPDPNDITEGVAAFKDIIEYFAKNSRNLDLGGGQYDDSTEYLNSQNIYNHVADLFCRSVEHNVRVLSSGPYDSVTSISVLNVIDTSENRLKHVKLSYEMLKPGKCAYFKIFEGDQTGISYTENKRHQENKLTSCYVELIKQVYPVVTIKKAKNLIIAIKRE
eukprot:NODE_51_length_27121_cov_0.309452.p13 type:complete len:184 gc:universal NODE_51_length_27121_cov_0.309452:17201-16650(-)